MAEPLRVLHVDDDPEFGELTAQFLERRNERFDVDTETSVEAALARLTDEGGFDCIVSDYDMPGTDGLAFLDAVREEDADLPFILFTGKGSEEIASRAISAGVTDYLQKGSGADQYAILANRIANAVDRYRARREVEASERRLRRIHERITDGFVAVDADWRYTYVNSVAEELLDRPEAELRGETVWESFPELVDSEFEDALRTAMESQETTGVTAYYAPLDAWFEVRAYPSEEGLSVYFTDVTDRKERDRQLRRERNRLSALFENFPEPTFGYVYEDGDRVIEAVNEAFEETFGFDAGTAVGSTVTDLIVPPAERETAAGIDERVRAGDRVDVRVRRRTAEGVRDFRFRNISMPDEPGIDGFAVYTDVTERAAYRRELERFRDLVENVPIGIFRTEAEEGGGFVEVNPALVSMFGGDDRSDLLDAEVRDLYADEADREWALGVLEEEGKITAEIEFRTLDGDPFWARVTSYFAETDEGRYLDGAIEHISETVEKRRLLEEQNERLEVLNRVLRHDIANDMQVALGMSEQLGSHVDPEGREYLDRLEANVEHAVDVTETVRTLMEVMLSDRGTEPVPTALGPVLESELDGVADAADSAVVELDGDLPDVRVLADGALDSVFRNLLGNAVEHNDAPVPEVRVSTTAGPETVTVRVADNGPGVPDGAKESIFHRGERGGNSRGSGIGLYLVRTLVEGWGGDVWVEDADSGGAAFVVELRRADR